MIQARCISCGETFIAESTTWARNKRTGVDCGGGNAATHEWYPPGNSQVPWPAAEVQEFEIQVGGINDYGRCKDCIDGLNDSPLDAGESWSEDL